MKKNSDGFLMKWKAATAPPFDPSALAICAGVIYLLAATVCVQAQYAYTTLSVPGSTETFVYGLSGGNVVGMCETTNGPEGFVYHIEDGTYTNVIFPGAIATEVYGISGNVMVGNCYFGNGHFGFLHGAGTASYTIFMANAPIAEVNGISGNTIVGSLTFTNGMEGFVYDIDSETYTTLAFPGATTTVASGVSDGNVAGYYVTNGDNQGFIYNGSTYTSLSVPGAKATWIYGISGNDLAGAFIYTKGQPQQGFTYNGSAFTTFTVPGAIETTAFGFDGTNVAGVYGTTNGGYYGFLATPLTLNLRASAVGGQFHLNVSSPPELTIVLASTNLVDWVGVYTNTPPFTFTDSAMTTFPCRFYRALIQQ